MVTSVTLFMPLTKFPKNSIIVHSRIFFGMKGWKIRKALLKVDHYGDEDGDGKFL